MEKKYELIIFDLDGTLLDTSKGIFNSVRYAEEKMEFAPISDEELKEFVGPPPKSIYMRMYGVDEEKALQAAQFHREYGRTRAIYEAKIYPGMLKTLHELKSNGYKLAVATLKSQGIAEEVLRNFELSQYFDCIVGMDVNELLTKAQTIKMAIEKTNMRGKVLMVGDSSYDMDGAKEVVVDFIGVLYGFGFKDIVNFDIKYIKNTSELLELV